MELMTEYEKVTTNSIWGREIESKIFIGIVRKSMKVVHIVSTFVVSKRLRIAASFPDRVNHMGLGPQREVCNILSS